MFCIKRLRKVEKLKAEHFFHIMLTKCMEKYLALGKIRLVLYS